MRFIIFFYFFFFLFLAALDALGAPGKLGDVPPALFANAKAYLAANPSIIKNKNYLVIIDYAKSSKQYRFFIVDLKTSGVEMFHVAHGSGGDKNHDGISESFSNVPKSNATSLGFFTTAETYTGKHGYSLRLDGRSSTNSNARSRAVVIHAAKYVKEANVIQGRSWGCPALAPEVNKYVIDKIKGGVLVYAGRSGN